MAVPTDVVWACKPHTVAKHRILERYLEAWFPILMQARFPSATYAEGFAGAGVYKNGEPGSPVKAARVFLARPHFLEARTLRMVLVEADGRRLERLKEEMGTALSQDGQPPAGLKVHYEEGKCAARLFPALAAAQALDGPVFAFLDSFGGPDVPLALARSIARRPSGEVLVTFGTRFLTRFGSSEQYQAAGDDAFGGPAWRRVHQLPAGEKKAFLVTAYRDSLKEAGFTYVVSFEMIDDTGADLHLVFGTSNLRGLEKMKDAMWNVDPVTGVRYRDPRDPDQLVLDFDLNPHLEPLTGTLLRELASGEHTVAQLRDYALLETVYRRPDATKALRAMLGSSLIERTPATGQLTGSTRIRLTQAGRQRLAAPELTLF